jgi:DNA-binding NtrC family response regulator
LATSPHFPCQLKQHNHLNLLRINNISALARSLPIRQQGWRFMNDENAGPWWRIAKMRILIIADDLWIRDSLIHYFETYGSQIEAFDNGKKAQEALASQSFDIIIADYKLSDMNGIDFFRQIQLSQLQSIKILITAGRNVELYTDAQNMGIGIIEKPFTADTIDEAFSQFIKENENFATDH